VQTRAVARRTTLVLLRLRFHIVSRDPGGRARELLAEEVALRAFTGSPDAPEWLGNDATAALVRAEPSANVADDVKRHQLTRVLDRFEALRPAFEAFAHERGDALLAAHRRVRSAGKLALRDLRVEPHLPADVLGVFVFMPGAA
jgi:hypothetical protein